MGRLEVLVVLTMVSVFAAAQVRSCAALERAANVLEVRELRDVARERQDAIFDEQSMRDWCDRGGADSGAALP